MRGICLFLCAFTAIFAATTVARANDEADCLSNDHDRRIAACTRIIENRETHPEHRGNALGLRGLSYATRNEFDKALADYDGALAILPGSPIILNNRAWLLVKLGRPLDGLADVEEALRIQPDSLHAYDTRAHIRLAQGLREEALGDFLYVYEYGGEDMQRLYICGLIEAGIIPNLGEKSPTANKAIPSRRIEVVKALAKCVDTSGCSPVPKDEKPC